MSDKKKFDEFFQGHFNTYINIFISKHEKSKDFFEKCSF